MLFEIYVIYTTIALFFSLLSIRYPVFFSLVAMGLWLIDSQLIANIEFAKPIFNNTAGEIQLYTYKYYDADLSYLFLALGIVFFIWWVFGLAQALISEVEEAEKEVEESMKRLDRVLGGVFSWKR